MGFYIGKDGTAHRAVRLYMGDNNVARAISRLYMGDANGKARLIYSSGLIDPHTLVVIDSSGNIRYSTDRGATWNTGANHNQFLVGYDGVTERWYSVNNNRTGTIYYTTNLAGTWTSIGRYINSFGTCYGKYASYKAYSDTVTTFFDLEKGTQFSATLPIDTTQNTETDGAGNYHSFSPSSSGGGFIINTCNFTITDANVVTNIVERDYNRVENYTVNVVASFWNGHNFVDVVGTNNGAIFVGMGGGTLTKVLETSGRWDYILATQSKIICWTKLGDQITYAYGNLNNPLGTWTTGTTTAPSALAEESSRIIYDGQYFYMFCVISAKYLYRTDDLTHPWTQITNFTIKETSDQTIYWPVSGSYPYTKNSWRKY